MSLTVFACADGASVDADTESNPVLAAESPWIDDVSSSREDEPGLGEPTDTSETMGPWIDPEITVTDAGRPNVGITRGRGYDFELGVDGWVASGAPIVQISSSTQQAVSGRRALAVDIGGAGKAEALIFNPTVRPGAIVTFHVWIPAGARLNAVQPYVQQGESTNWHWTGNWQKASVLRPNAWNQLKVVVPLNARALWALGVQVETAGFWRGRIYVDAVSF